MLTAARSFAAVQLPTSEEFLDFAKGRGQALADVFVFSPCGGVTSAVCGSVVGPMYWYLTQRVKPHHRHLVDLFTRGSVSAFVAECVEETDGTAARPAAASADDDDDDALSMGDDMDMEGSGGGIAAALARSACGAFVFPVASDFVDIPRAGLAYAAARQCEIADAGIDTAASCVFMPVSELLQGPVEGGCLTVLAHFHRTAFDDPLCLDHATLVLLRLTACLEYALLSLGVGAFGPSVVLPESLAVSAVPSPDAAWRTLYHDEALQRSIGPMAAAIVGAAAPLLATTAASSADSVLPLNVTLPPVRAQACHDVLPELIQTVAGLDFALQQCRRRHTATAPAWQTALATVQPYRRVLAASEAALDRAQRVIAVIKRTGVPSSRIVPVRRYNELIEALCQGGWRWGPSILFFAAENNIFRVEAYVQRWLGLRLTSPLSAFRRLDDAQEFADAGVGFHMLGATVKMLCEVGQQLLSSYMRERTVAGIDRSEGLRRLLMTVSAHGASAERIANFVDSGDASVGESLINVAWDAGWATDQVVEVVEQAFSLLSPPSWFAVPGKPLAVKDRAAATMRALAFGVLKGFVEEMEPNCSFDQRFAQMYSHFSPTALRGSIVPNSLADGPQPASARAQVGLTSMYGHSGNVDAVRVPTIGCPLVPHFGCAMLLSSATTSACTTSSLQTVLVDSVNWPSVPALAGRFFLPYLQRYAATNERRHRRDAAAQQRLEYAVLAAEQQDSRMVVVVGRHDGVGTTGAPDSGAPDRKTKALHCFHLSDSGGPAQVLLNDTHWETRAVGIDRHLVALLCHAEVKETGRSRRRGSLWNRLADNFEFPTEDVTRALVHGIGPRQKRHRNFTAYDELALAEHLGESVYTALEGFRWRTPAWYYGNENWTWSELARSHVEVLQDRYNFACQAFTLRLAREQLLHSSSVARPSDHGDADGLGRKLQEKMGRGGAASITFEGVSFAYPGSPDVLVLRDVSFHIPAGAFAAIVGESGAGKSTVIGLLLRVHDPSAGRILLDGIDLRAFTPRWLRRHVGLVAQTCGWLPRLRVSENLALGNVDAATDAARQRQALCAAKAVGIVDARPKGLEACLEPGELSGGERQRLAIARAMMKHAAITTKGAVGSSDGEVPPLAFVMDEATSALDVETERDVQRTLASSGRDQLTPPPTTVAVAHRLSTVRHASHVVVMGAGGVVLEFGAFPELAGRKGGALARLVRLQDTAPPSDGAAPVTTQEEKVPRGEDTEAMLFARLAQSGVGTNRLRNALEHLR